jgi:rRNA maturation endonuclease Nob1
VSSLTPSYCDKIEVKKLRIKMWHWFYKVTNVESWRKRCFGCMKSPTL